MIHTLLSIFPNSGVVMRPDRLRLRAIAAWLGVIALGLNALVPIHFAFDLAHVLASGEHHEGTRAGEHGFGWRVLALLTGHQDADDKTDSRGGHADCAVCGSVGTLAGFAPAAAVVLPLPGRVGAPTLAAAARSELQAAPPAAYQSRAPPARIG